MGHKQNQDILKAFFMPNLRLKNFQSLRGEVEIPLKPVTLMFGPNSAGKSAVMEALELIRNLLSESYSKTNSASVALPEKIHPFCTSLSKHQNATAQSQLKARLKQIEQTEWEKEGTSEFNVNFERLLFGSDGEITDTRLRDTSVFVEYGDVLDPLVKENDDELVWVAFEHDPPDVNTIRGQYIYCAEEIQRRLLNRPLNVSIRLETYGFGDDSRTTYFVNQKPLFRVEQINEYHWGDDRYTILRIYLDHPLLEGEIVRVVDRHIERNTPEADALPQWNLMQDLEIGDDLLVRTSENVLALKVFNPHRVSDPESLARQQPEAIRAFFSVVGEICERFIFSDLTVNFHFHGVSSNRTVPSPQDLKFFAPYNPIPKDSVCYRNPEFEGFELWRLFARCV